jgi:hypothetical protein
VLRGFAVAVLVLAAGLAAFVQIQQHILRWRAERLLADIREIQMGKSTWADAQRLMKQWGKWGGWQGSCTAKRCDYQIVMEDSFRALPTFYVPSGDLRIARRTCCRWLWKPYMALGGRLSQVNARLEVKDGVVWAKSIFVEIGTFKHMQDQSDPISYSLVGNAAGMTSFPFDSRPNLLTRPEYLVSRPDGCEGCAFIGSHFSPFADPVIVNQLLDFNLGCLTRYHPCEGVDELMPSAWRLYNQTGQEGASDQRIEPSDAQKLEIAGRDERFVAIAEVADTRYALEEGKRIEWFAFRIVQSLKNGVPVGPPHRWEPNRAERSYPGSEGTDDLKKGDRLIVFFAARTNRSDPPNAGTELDDFAAYTTRNLEIVQRGIARDKLADVP